MVETVDNLRAKPTIVNYVAVLQSVLSDDKDKAFKGLLGLIIQLGEE
jgi:hypothetical protein